jgi:hypothetical protein
MQRIESKISKITTLKTPIRLTDRKTEIALNTAARRVEQESSELNGSISNEWLNSCTDWSVVDKKILVNIDLYHIKQLVTISIDNLLEKSNSINLATMFAAANQDEKIKVLVKSSEIKPERNEKISPPPRPPKAFFKSSPIKHELKFLLFNIALLACMLSMNNSGVHGCDVWKASDCMGSITTAEEEIMKSDDYTKEELFKYCDKGKAYVDCVNNKLKCCDLKPELRGSLAAYDKQLEKQAWKLGPFCAGLGESNVIKYKCRTTTKATTTTATKSSKSTMAPCQVEKVCKA